MGSWESEEMSRRIALYLEYFEYLEYLDAEQQEQITRSNHEAFKDMLHAFDDTSRSETLIRPQ